MQKNIPLQDSITTWQFIGISLSRSLGKGFVATAWPAARESEDGEPAASSPATVIFLCLGICVAEPLEVIVRKDFFLDLKLPNFAVRGEQLEIKVVVYNYSPYPDFVREGGFSPIPSAICLKPSEDKTTEL